MRRKAVLLAVAAWVCQSLLAAEPVAGELSLQTNDSFRVSASTHAIFSSARPPDDPGSPATGVFMNESAVRGEYGQYNLGIGFTNRLTTNGPRELNSPFVLQKKTLGAQWGDFQLRLGDTYQQLGRGIALALYRDPVFGLDTTLEGGDLHLRPAGWDIALFGGRVNALTVPVAVNPAPNPIEGRQVWLAGTSVGANVGSGMKVGGHYLLAMNRPLDKTLFDKRWHTVGAIFSSDDVLPGVDLYTESNVLVSGFLELKQKRPTGYATFGSLSWSPLPWIAKVEVKDYRQYYFDFRRPPTLEDDVIVSLNTQDVTAARFYTERRFDGTRHAAYASYLVGDDRQKSLKVQHGILGGKIHGPWKTYFEAKAGYRLEGNKSDMWHGSLKGQLPTGRGGEMIELWYRRQYTRGTLDQAPTAEERNQLYLTYTFSDHFSTQVGWEYMPTNTPDNRHFFNGGATYTDGRFMAKAFAGQTSGGTLCSGGVCRQVPPYTGLMAETTITF